MEELARTVPVPAWRPHASPQTAGYTLRFRCAWASHQVGQQSPEPALAPLLKLLSAPGGAHRQAGGFPGPRAPGYVCLVVPVLPEDQGAWVSWGPPSVPRTSPTQTRSGSPTFTRSTLAPGCPPPAPGPVSSRPPAPRALLWPPFPHSPPMLVLSASRPHPGPGDTPCPLPQAPCLAQREVEAW